MNDDLDTLLSSNLLAPPADFTQRVMQSVERLPRRTLAVKPRATFASLLRRIAAAAALAGAGMLGLSQLAGFMFGLWLASAAL
jgi:anti-sigma factor RsiW